MACWSILPVPVYAGSVKDWEVIIHGQDHLLTEC